MFVCDWCGEEIESKLGMVTMIIDGMFADASGLLDGRIYDQRRHFHCGTGNDDDSCMLQALHLIDSRETAVETLENIPTVTEARVTRMRAKHHKPDERGEDCWHVGNR